MEIETKRILHSSPPDATESVCLRHQFASFSVSRLFTRTVHILCVVSPCGSESFVENGQNQTSMRHVQTHLAIWHQIMESEALKQFNNVLEITSQPYLVQVKLPPHGSSYCHRFITIGSFVRWENISFLLFPNKCHQTIKHVSTFFKRTEFER